MNFSAFHHGLQLERHALSLQQLKRACHFPSNRKAVVHEQQLADPCKANLYMNYLPFSVRIDESIARNFQWQ